MTNGKIRVCLHNHTRYSRYGLSWIDDFRRALREKRIDKVAITDHNTIEGALLVQAELGRERIIVGEEVTSAGGEIIGLFLEGGVEQDLSLLETCTRIKDQGGAVYIPHPGIGGGVALGDLEEVIQHIDIIEVHNGWMHLVIANRKRRREYREREEAWCFSHGIPAVSATDSHYPKNIGRSCTVMDDFTNAEELKTRVSERGISLVCNQNKFGIEAIPAAVKGLIHFRAFY